MAKVPNGIETLPKILIARVGRTNVTDDFLCDIVHTLQNTIDWCTNSATDRRGYVLERRFTKFSEITQCNGHYAVQGHSRSPILVPIESPYDFLLVINTYLRTLQTTDRRTGDDI